MVTRKPPFLSGGQIRQLHTLMGRGLQTVEDFQSPELELVFRRRDPDRGWDTVVTLTPISVKLNNQQSQESPANLGGTETRTAGVVTVWANDVLVMGPFPDDPYTTGKAFIQQGDRFNWRGHGCVVDLVPPDRLGTISIDFTLLEGN